MLTHTVLIHTQSMHTSSIHSLLKIASLVRSPDEAIIKVRWPQARRSPLVDHALEGRDMIGS
jgi:hypothetical protein